MFFEQVLHALLHALTDTLKVTLFLFLTYLVMEFLEHRSSGKSEEVIKKAGRLGPLAGGLFGAIPQCGFSAAASGLYAGRLITRGTLIALFLATSDEMLPLMLSGVAEGKILPIKLLTVLGLKVIGGVLIGFLIDFIWKNDHHSHEIEDFCSQEGCNCGHDGIWLSALKHTLKIAVFVLISTFAINLIIELVGEDSLGSLMRSIPVLGELISALFGLIPNCAVSVVITKLYIGGTITAGQMLAGLFTGAGVGVLVLFRTNRNIKENLLLMLVLYVSGAALGLLLGSSGLASLLGL